MKKINVIFFLLWFLPGIDDAKVPAPPNNYHLVGFAEDLSSVAGIVSGIAVAQQIQEATLKEDELVGELFLGPDRKMGSLADVDASGLAMDLEEIGKVVGKECGSGGCGKFDVKAAKHGIDVLVAIDGALTGQQKDLLRDKQAFAELTEVQGLLKALVKFETEISTIYDELNSTNMTNHGGLASFFSQNVKVLKKVGAPESEFEKLKTSVVLLKTAKRAKFIEKIDILLGLESIHKNLSAGKDQVEKMNNELAPIAQRSTELAVAISRGRVGRIEQTMDELTPIVSWSSKHPLLRLIFDFDKSVSRFMNKFFSGANADGKSEARLKPVLEPIKRLSTDLKPLQMSWSSMKKPDRILESIEKVRSNLTVALSELDALSLLSSLHQCFKDVTLGSSSLFDELRAVKKQLNEIEDDRVDSIISLQNPYKNLTKFFHFVKTGFEKGSGIFEIMSQMAKITNVAEVLEELREFEGQNKVKNLATGDIEKVFESKALKTVFSNLKMDSLIDALDCVKKDNLLSKDVRPADLTSLRNLNSDNLEMQALISTSRHVNRAMEEWTSMSSKKAPQGKTRRAAETQNGMLNDASRLAKTFLDAVKTTIDLAATFKAKERLIDFFKSERVIDEEISALSDQQRKQTLANVWNEDTKEALRQYQPEMERLDGYFSTRPDTLEELSGLFKSLHSFAVSPFDSFAFSKAMSFVKDSVARSRLLVFGQVDLRFDNANARLENASSAFVPLVTYFNGLLDVWPDRTIVNSTIASAPAEESFFFISERDWAIIGSVLAAVVVVSLTSFLIWKCRRNGYKLIPKESRRLKLIKKHLAEEKRRKEKKEKARVQAQLHNELRALLRRGEQQRRENNPKEVKRVGDGALLDENFVSERTVNAVRALSVGGVDARENNYENAADILREQIRKHDPEANGGINSIPMKEVSLLEHYSVEFLKEPLTREMPKYEPSNVAIKLKTFVSLLLNNSQKPKDASAKGADDQNAEQVDGQTAASPKTTMYKRKNKKKKKAKKSKKTKKPKFAKTLVTQVQETEPLLAETASTTRKVAGDDSTNSECDDVECPPQYYKISEVERNGGVVQRLGQPMNPEADYIEMKAYKGCCLKFRYSIQDYEKTKKNNDIQQNRTRITRLAVGWIMAAAEARVAAGADKKQPSWRKKLRKGHNPSEELRKKYFKTDFVSNGKIDYFALLSNLLGPAFVLSPGFFLPRFRPDAEINPFHVKEVQMILMAATAAFDKDPAVLVKNCQPIVLGDSHGDYRGMINILFGRGKKFLEKPIIFLGDIVDRGPRSICCLILICVLKLCYPDRIFWIRGNHEFLQTNSVYGLLEESLGGFGEDGEKVHRDMNMMMEKLPMCCILNNIFLLCHGGWSLALTSRQKFFDLVRKVENKDISQYNESDLIGLGLCWSDPFIFYPKGNIDEIVTVPSNRGTPGAVMFNMAANADMSIKCGIQMLIRGHQIRPHGFYDYPVYKGIRLLTLYSAPDSIQLGSPKSNNWAGFLEFCDNNVLKLHHYIDVITHTEDAQFAVDDTEWDEPHFQNTRAQANAAQ